MAIKRKTAIFLGLALATGMIVAPGVGASGVTRPAVTGCADNPDHLGGDWRYHGRDLGNTRGQPAEDTIGAGTVGRLKVAAQSQPYGNTNGTPIIHKGCLVATTAAGEIVVLNADTLALVWRSGLITGNGNNLAATVITGSAAVSEDFWIYAGVNCTGESASNPCNPGGGLATNRPYTIAFRPLGNTGQWIEAWKTTVDQTPNAQLVPGPLLYGGFRLCTTAEIESANDPGDCTWAGTYPTTAHPDIAGRPIEAPYRGPFLYQGHGGQEGGPDPRGGYVILHPRTGRVLAKGYTIDQASYDAGYRGASIWGVAAIDEQHFIYAPTGNPAGRNLHHANANAVVKIDGDPSSPTFGQIVATGRGTPDHYVEHIDPYNVGGTGIRCPAGGVIWGQGCLQQDLDFGGVQTLFKGPSGESFVGGMQKSGVFHAFDRRTMDRAWSRVLGTPSLAMNAAGAAYDGTQLYVTAQEPDLLWGIAAHDGNPTWAHGPALQSVYHFTSPVSTANGVVYMRDITGSVRGIDAATGVLLFHHRPGSTATSTSAGIAIARNTVYVPIGSTIFAYRLSATVA